MGRRGLWIQADAVAAGVDALLGQRRTLRIVRGEIGQIKRGAAELPGGLHAVGFLLVSRPGFFVEELWERGDGCDAGGFIGCASAGSSKRKTQSPKEEPGPKT